MSSDGLTGNYSKLIKRRILYRKVTSQAKELSQQVKYFLYKCENLSSDPKTPPDTSHGGPHLEAQTSNGMMGSQERRVSGSS